MNNCPHCLSKGFHKKLIKQDSYYICEDVLCTYIDIENETRQTLINVSEIGESLENNDIAISSKNECFYCPLCKELGKNKKINKCGNYFACEDLECIFFEDIESVKISKISKIILYQDDVEMINMSEMIPSFEDNTEIPSTSMQNVPENVNAEIENFKNTSEDNDINNHFDNIEIVNLVSELDNFPSKDQDQVIIPPVETCAKAINKERQHGYINIFNKSIEMDNKSSLITDKLYEQLNIILWETSTKLFNWVAFTCTMKAHSRILCTLLIYLDTFIVDCTSPIISIKKEYSFCNAFANNFKKDPAKMMAFNFINKLFDIFESIPTKNLADKEMDERLSMSFVKYFAKFDSLKKMALEYTINKSCSTCLENSTEIVQDYFLPLEKRKDKFKLVDNTLNYIVKCAVCKGQCKKTIKITKIPQFVIFHSQKGINEKLSKFNNGFISDGMESLKLIAVVECIDKYPYADCVEQRMNLFDYSKMMTSTVIRQNFMVHFKNTDGWYSLNYMKPLLSSPSENLDIENGAYIRYLIFGTTTDAAKYKGSFTLQQFTEKYQSETKAELKKIFSKTEDDAIYKKALENVSKPCKKKRKKINNISELKISEEDLAAIESIPWLVNGEEDEAEVEEECSPRIRKVRKNGIRPMGRPEEVSPPVSPEAQQSPLKRSGVKKSTTRSRDSGLSSRPSTSTFSADSLFDYEGPCDMLHYQPTVNNNHNIDRMIELVRSKVTSSQV